MSGGLGHLHRPCRFHYGYGPAPSANAVVANTDNVAPEFKEGGDKPVMQATRYIVESADADAQDAECRR